MAHRTLTPLQRGVIERMRYRGLDTLAEVVRGKWQQGQHCSMSLPDHPRLDADLKRADEQVGTKASSPSHHPSWSG